ncbi:uncharacterized protein A4U43_C02F4710 [Asparagus officinalis]|uniref:Uncharacterized protein n=1 Tax=Asparagus officinalis TaxID=4686 RepID=A0A5P1FJZ5_ASPOF|nr:uncharacterized protein A4U43_C02F4710 [Asparagus officinalis]
MTSDVAGQRSSLVGVAHAGALVSPRLHAIEQVDPLVTVVTPTRVPYLDMYLNELRVLMGADAASPFQRCLAAVERDIQALHTLRSENLVVVATENARSILKEQEQFLDETMAEETRLSIKIERATAVGKEGEISGIPTIRKRTGLRITAVATAEQEGYVETSDGGGDQGSDGGDSVVGRTKSLTDEDLEELKGCLDLGFGFSYEEIPELCSTLPALELCYSISQRYMDEQQQRTAVDEEAAETSSGAPIANWKISSPGEISNLFVIFSVLD